MGNPFEKPLGNLSGNDNEEGEMIDELCVSGIGRRRMSRFSVGAISFLFATLSTTTDHVAGQPRSPLTAAEHTKIIQNVISNTRGLREKNVVGKSGPVILRTTATLPKVSPSDAKLLQRAAGLTAQFEKDKAKVEKTNPLLKATEPVIAQLERAPDLAALESILSQAAKDSSLPEAIRIGTKFGHDIIVDGKATIYNPEFWTVALSPDDVFIGQLKSAGRGVAAEIGNKILDVAKADARGAVTGAASGAAQARAQGGNQAAVAAAAAAGAASGAASASAGEIM
jgi:hypothetical protein